MPRYHHVWWGAATVLRFDPDKEQFFLRILSSNYGWIPVNKPDYVQWLNLMDKIYHNREAING